MVAAEVGAGLPVASPHQVAVSQCDIWLAEQGFFPVAAACWCASIKDMPVLLGCPVIDELANTVRVITRNILGGVVAIYTPQDHPVLLCREGDQREAVDSLICHGRPEGRAVDVVNVEVSRRRGLCVATFSRCPENGSYSAPLGGVVLWLER